MKANWIVALAFVFLASTVLEAQPWYKPHCVGQMGASLRPSTA